MENNGKINYQPQARIDVFLYDSSVKIHCFFSNFIP